MAITFTQQPGIRQYMDPNVDPTVSSMAFLSYAATDWCSKIGDDKVVVLTGHEQWDQIDDQYLTPTSNIYFQLLIRGEGYRNGLAPFLPNIYEIYAGGRTASNTIHSGLAAGSYNVSDPNDWTQWDRQTQTWAGQRVNPFNNTSLWSNTYYYTNGGVYTDQYLGWAMYNDTPGKEWFYFNNPWDSSATAHQSFLLMRYTPLSGIPTNDRDLGWIIAWPNNNNYYKVLSNFTTSETSNLWKLSNIRRWRQASTMTFGQGNTDTSTLMHSLPVSGPGGDLFSYYSDELISTEDNVIPGYQYQIPPLGSYTAIGSRMLIKTA